MPAPITSKQPEQVLPRIVDGFRLVRELGRGGMGVVYQAEELSSGRLVALKVLAADQRVSEEAFERFRRESRTAASISDSRCVFVYGAHQVEGSPAIAMELCPGETLEHRLAKHETIPIQKAVRWTLEILEGLEAAHRAGVVHRDVKPSNCFITQDDHVKVGDFGLSRSLDTDIRLTQSGAFLGSPLYASPEQIRGREIDARSDIYSTGATLFALLAGRAPYHGQNIGEVLARILSESPPALRSLRPDVPADLEKVVARAMERDPERRFPDHASFRAALEPFVAGEAIPAGRAKRVLAYILDQMLTTAVVSGLMFAGMAQSWSWTALDLQTGLPKSLPAMLILNCVPAVYFALCEGLAGATPGKWILGLRVVDARTQQLNLPRCVVRAAAFALPGLLSVVVVANLTLSPGSYKHWGQVGAVVNFCLLASSMRRRNGFRGLHEFASGTRVVQARSPFSRFRGARPVPAHPTAAVDGFPSELGTYKLEGSVGLTPTGVLLHCTDQKLERSVWMYARTRETRVSSDERRSLARPGRLRWLDSVRQGETLFEMYEAPGGASLSACIAQSSTIDWPTAHRVLSGLADELASSNASGHAAGSGALDRVCFEQLWIDRTWNVRVLDEPIGPGAFTFKPPVELLSDAARAMLRNDAASGALLPSGLPTSADPIVRRLLGVDAPYASIEEANRDLASLSGRPMTLTSPARAIQIAVSMITPLLALVASVVAMFALSDPIDNAQETMRSIRQLQAQRADPPPAELMNDEDRRAREIVIGHSFSQIWTANLLSQLKPEEVEIHEQAVAAHPSPTADEVAWAREQIRARPFKGQDPSASGDSKSASNEPDAVRAKVGPYSEVAVSPNDDRSIRQIRWLVIPFFVALTVGVWGVLSTIFALIFRGGLSLKIFGIGVRTRRGELASRLRCALRSLIVWIPVLILYGVASWLSFTDHAAAGMTLMLCTVVVHALALAYAIWRPSRSVQDRLARTELVPR